MVTRISAKVKPFVEKAKSSALQAVEVYNKPGSSFKSAAFLVLMNIAWTAAFHGYFLRNRKFPYYKENGSKTYIKEDGDYRYWDISRCVKEYYKTVNSAERANLELLMSLRDKIEHKHLPALDQDLFGFCQQLLFNFDDFMGKAFGESHRIRESLSFSLQMYRNPGVYGKAVLQDINYLKIKDFINHYQSTLAADIVGSDKFSFNMFMLKVKGNPGNALGVQFYDATNQNDGVSAFINNAVVILKKEIPTDSATTHPFSIKSMVVQLKKEFGKLPVTDAIVHQLLISLACRDEDKAKRFCVKRTDNSQLWFSYETLNKLKDCFKVVRDSPASIPEDKKALYPPALRAHINP